MHQEDRYVVIGDSSSSHFTSIILEKCKEKNIDFVCLPAYSDYLLQPIYMSYFGQMKNAWRTILTQWEEGEGKNETSIPKHKFPEMLRKILDELDLKNKKNIIEGFLKCGLVPLNASIVLNRLRKRTEPSYVTGAISANILNVLRFNIDQQPRKGKKLVNVITSKNVTQKNGTDDTETPDAETSDTDQDSSTISLRGSRNEHVNSQMCGKLSYDEEDEEDGDEENKTRTIDCKHNIIRVGLGTNFVSENLDRLGEASQTAVTSQDDTEKSLVSNRVGPTMTIEANDWVIIEYPNSKMRDKFGWDEDEEDKMSQNGSKKYVVHIKWSITNELENKFSVLFYKRYCFDNTFYRPIVDHSDLIDENKIVLKLPTPIFDQWSDKPKFAFNFENMEVV
jgi:hypothetical protein